MPKIPLFSPNSKFLIGIYLLIILERQDDHWEFRPLPDEDLEDWATKSLDLKENNVSLESNSICPKCHIPTNVECDICGQEWS